MIMLDEIAAEDDFKIGKDIDSDIWTYRLSEEEQGTMSIGSNNFEGFDEIFDFAAFESGINF